MPPLPSNYSLPHPPRLSHAHTNKIKKANDAHFGSLVSASLPPLSHTHFNLCTHTSTPKSIPSLLPLTQQAFHDSFPHHYPSVSLNFSIEPLLFYLII